MEIIAFIFTKLIIEWTTVSTTSPVRDLGGPGYTYAVYVSDACNQIGADYEVTMAKFDWQGKEKIVEIARKKVESATVATRSIPCDKGMQRIMGITE